MVFSKIRKNWIYTKSRAAKKNMAFPIHFSVVHGRNSDLLNFGGRTLQLPVISADNLTPTQTLRTTHLTDTWWLESNTIQETTKLNYYSNNGQSPSAVTLYVYQPLRNSSFLTVGGMMKCVSMQTFG